MVKLEGKIGEFKFVIQEQNGAECIEQLYAVLLTYKDMKIKIKTRNEYSVKDTKQSYELPATDAQGKEEQAQAGLKEPKHDNQIKCSQCGEYGYHFDMVCNICRNCWLDESV